MKEEVGYKDEYISFKNFCILTVYFSLVTSIQFFRI